MDPFTPLQPYNLLICKQCRYGVVVREVETHLRAHHKQIPLPRRKQIIQATQRRGTWLQGQKDLEGFLLPTEPIAVIPALDGPYHDGFKCSNCCFISRQVSNPI